MSPLIPVLELGPPHLLPHIPQGIEFVLGGEIVFGLPAVDLDALKFRVETNPSGPAIDLVWELPDPTGPVDGVELRVLRRVRRFPGRSRRGVVSVVATADDLAEGDVVYDTATVTWDLEETRDEVFPDMRVSTTRQFFYRGTPRDRILVRTIRHESPPEGGPPTRTIIRYVDRAGLEVGTIYYYTAFAGAPFRFSSRTQSSALATGTGGPELFRLLPKIDQQRDTEAPEPFSVANAEHDRGQLERLLRTTQVHGDMLMGFVDGLRDLHDPRRVDSRLLEAMADLIGWNLKAYLTEEGQRNEIVFANDVYRTLGTKPNIAAMVNRLTGWTADVKEFARNVVLSWDSTRVERLEGGVSAYLDGSAVADGTPPVLNTQTVPVGSVNTADPNAMFRLRNRTFEDATAYTYDCGVPDPAGGYIRNDAIWYNRETLGVYATPDVATEPFALQQTWERVRVILGEFLPIQVRPVLFIRPGVVNEDPYVATTQVVEDVTTLATLVQAEDYDATLEDALDKIPQWRWLIANQLASRSVNTAAVDLSHRSVHTGVVPGP
ncbi:MAG TPA: hypothetical protein VIL98_06195 [Gaiellaceae bacterium]